MKEFFVRHALPTARHVTFTDFAAAKAHVESIDYPVVVKASGLAGGKGVLMPTSKEETVEALKQVMVDKASNPNPNPKTLNPKTLNPKP